MSIRVIYSSRENREFWFFVYKTSLQVSGWPKWRRANLIKTTYELDMDGYGRFLRAVEELSVDPCGEFSVDKYVRKINALIRAARREWRAKRRGRSKTDIEFEREIAAYAEEIERVRKTKSK